MAQTFGVNSSTIGVDLNNFSATALFAVGTHVLGSNGTEWVYVQAATSVNGLTWVAYNSGTFTCAMASGGDLLAASQIAVAQTSCSAQAFFWVAIRGIGLTVSQTGTTSALGAVYLGASSTPTGLVSLQISASGTLQGVSLVATVSTTLGVFNLTWPKGVAAGL